MLVAAKQMILNVWLWSGIDWI